MIKNTLFALLALLVLGAGGLAAVSLRPSGGGVLAGAAFAGSLLASPRTAMAAMGRLWADEHPAGQGPAAGQGQAGQADAAAQGGFWTGLPAGGGQTQQGAAAGQGPQQTAQPAGARPGRADQRPEGTVPVEEITYTAQESDLCLPCGAGFVKNLTRLPRAEVAAEIGQPLPFSVQLGTAEPQVLIMHTHTTECYQPTADLWCDPAYPARTTDNSQNMVAVGAEIARVLNAAGIATLQDATQHDYPSYNGSYDRSRATVEEYLRRYPSIKIVLDIHRDAIEREDGTRVAPVVEIGGQQAAQVMIICGADNGSMGMPNYKQNLRFAAALQSQLAALYPGLARPVLFDYRNYNQQLTTGSLLIEVGGHGNTLQQAKLSGRYIGRALASLLGAG